MTQFKTITLHRGNLTFSAGHFTVFSKTERETLHGHNYYVSAEITAAMDDAGITFDYRIIREKIGAICQKLNCRFMLPTLSPYLKIEETDTQVFGVFNNQRIPFLKDDVILLPIKNTTLEELSEWILAQCAIPEFTEKYHITKIRIDVFNGTDNSSYAAWTK